MTEFPIRPGCLLAGGSGPTKIAFSPAPQALFVFQLADPPNRDADRMRLVRSLAETASDEAAFLVAVALSSPAFDELLADDNSPGAAQIRTFHSDSSAPPLTLPLTAGARLAVESIRRCPFAGACRAMAFAARTNDLLIEFLTSLSAAALPAPLLRRLDEQIRSAAELLSLRLEDPPTLAALAHEIGLSETTLKRGFHQVFGTTVFAHLRALRMQRAHALLQSGEATVLEAAARVGYSNPSNFAAAFRRQFGVNPKEFQLAARVGGALAAPRSRETAP